LHNQRVGILKKLTEKYVSRTYFKSYGDITPYLMVGGEKSWYFTTSFFTSKIKGCFEIYITWGVYLVTEWLNEQTF